MSSHFDEQLSHVLCRTLEETFCSIDLSITQHSEGFVPQAYCLPSLARILNLSTEGIRGLYFPSGNALRTLATPVIMKDMTGSS